MPWRQSANDSLNSLNFTLPFSNSIREADKGTLINRIRNSFETSSVDGGPTALFCFYSKAVVVVCVFRVLGDLWLHRVNMAHGGA